MSTTRQIAPEFTFRFAVDEIKVKYGSAEGAFAAGDFLIATQLATDGSEIKGCALVLGGLTEEGLRLLEALPPEGERRLLCRALALWQLNRTEEARALLDIAVRKAPLAKIERFRRLLDRDDINVFVPGAMLPIFAEQRSASMVAPAYKYGPITAKYVASQMAENAYDYNPSDPLDEFIESLPAVERPDFLFALSPQWMLPRNFHKVTQPKLLWAHDTDVFTYRNVDNVRLYDIGICGCTHEHFELSSVGGIYSAANVMSNPLNMPFPEVSPPAEKKIDVMFSGSSLDHFHSEKPRFIYQMAELADKHVIKIIDGHVPEKNYFSLLTSAKFLTMVGRQAGAPSPRWRDALANGSCVLFPDGTFYDEVAQGCFPYRAESIVTDIRGHIERYDAGGTMYPGYDTQSIAADIEARLSIHRKPREELFASQLKYAAFLALVWRDVRSAERSQRRHIWLTPCVDAGIFGRENVRNKVADIAARIAPDEVTDAAGYSNAALMFAKLVFSFEHEDSRLPQWVKAADDYFAEGLARFPESLLLAFNNAHWKMFKPGASAQEAGNLFQSIIDRFDIFRFDPSGLDLGFPYMLLDRDPVFPYYEYADSATAELVRANTPEMTQETGKASTRDLLLAACLGYVGWAQLQANDKMAALGKFEVAFGIVPAQLPLLRLDFETRLSLAAAQAKPGKAEVTKLADVYIAVVNVYPTALLTHIAAVVPILARGNEVDAARDLLAAWYRLGNIVHSMGGAKSRFHDLETFQVIYHHRHLLPKELIGRVERFLKDPSNGDRLTQLELTLAEAARNYNPAVIERRLASRKWWLSVMGDTPQSDGKLSFALLLRAFKVWLKLPIELKRVYVAKAWSRLRNGNLRQTVIRTQLWGATSVWSRGLG